ncbi:CHAT domain-containing protein [Nonomuraea sp. NPDC049480]|uniref:CHAT domain-containing protein n=1 Tax=Nonomuraea sp. NPDC049480 TaxID=3364353 RepID=UPI00379C6C5F
MIREEQFDADRAADRRMALAREWDELLEQVRTLDGFEHFLKPPRLETLLLDDPENAVAVVNVSPWRCDALLVRNAGVKSRELPNLTAADARERANEYLRVLRRAETAADEVEAARERVHAGGSVADRQALQRAVRVMSDARADIEAMLTALLAWLWEVVAEPVLSALGHDGPLPEHSVWPRLWWCPTGPLALLPLHAAGHHDDPERTVIDRVVSSYTPTLRALMEAGKPLEEPGLERRLLVVAQSNTPGQRPLDGVADELEVLAKLFPAPVCTVLQNEEADRATVRAELRRHRWVHFSCHGDQILHDPSQGGLVLHDGMLTVADIASTHYSAEFAGLSACKTATGGIDLLDETITLVAALHYSGFRHVVGTLWSVYDAPETTDLFRELYSSMTVNGRLRPELSARSLHAAVRKLRDLHPRHPSVWTPFTHTGP